MEIQVKFRYLLPLIMTAVQLLLFVSTTMQQRGAGGRSALSVPVVRAAVLQEEGGTVSFEPMGAPRPSWVLDVASILNFPAMLGGVVLAELFHQESDAAILGFCVPFVPLVWYPIGKWIDGQIRPILMGKKRLDGRIARWALRVLSILGLLRFLFGFHGGWDPSESEFDFIPLGLWCTWYLFCSFWGEHRLRRLWIERNAYEGVNPLGIG